MPVTILPGTNRELNKTFTLVVTGDPGATVGTGVTTGTPASATGTIITNAPPAVNAVGAAVTESLTGTAFLPFEIQVAPSLTGPVVVNYTTADGTAVAGVDYGAPAGPSPWRPAGSSRRSSSPSTTSSWTRPTRRWRSRSRPPATSSSSTRR